MEAFAMVTEFSRGQWVVLVPSKAIKKHDLNSKAASEDNAMQMIVFSL
jgi:hypothetical protein